MVVGRRRGPRRDYVVLTGPNVILTLKIAVAAVTVLLIAAVIAVRAATIGCTDDSTSPSSR